MTVHKPGNKKLIRSAIPAVRQLFDMIDKAGMTHGQVARMAGVHNATLSYWKAGARSPNITDFEAVCNVMGMQICLEPQQ